MKFIELLLKCPKTLGSFLKGLIHIFLVPFLFWGALVLQMEHTTVQRRRVYLACRAIFTGQNALVRKPKKIKELVEEHRRSLKPLIQDIGINKVTEILRTLLEGQIFQSELKAKLQFPELFCSTPGRNIQRAESENNAAKSVAEALEEISSLEDSNDMNRDENGQAHQALSTVRHGNESKY
jgi:hypothetical protein